MRRAASITAIASAIALAAAPARAQPAPSASSAPKTTPPKLVKFVEAEFPESEKSSGRGATVVLQLGVSETGAVVKVAVVGSAGPAFDAAAVAAAKQFVFEPALRDGRPIAVLLTYRYEFVFRVEPVKKTTADFEGTVRDRRTKKPLAGVEVVLDTGQRAITDERGHFRIAAIEPGERGVTLSGAGVPATATRETFEAGKQIAAVYEIEPKLPKTGTTDDDDEYAVVVTAPRIVKEVVSTEVKSAEARRVPGTQGDVLKVVENLPGVARSAVGSGALVVWGAAPQDTRVYIDGVRVPRLYHDGGYRSIVHSDLVRAVELAPGGYGAAYGRGLGGLVTVQLRPLDENGVHGSVAADVLDAQVSTRAKIGDDLHVAIAGRRSHLRDVVLGVTDRDVGAYVPVPKYADAQAGVRYDISKHESVDVWGLYSTDAIDHTLARPDPADTQTESRSLDFWRVFARWEKRSGDGATTRITPSIGVDRARLTDRYGAVVTESEARSQVFAVRADWRGNVARFVTLHAGVDAEATFFTIHRSGSIGAPPREGDAHVFGQAPSGQINADDWKVSYVDVAPFAEADIALVSDRLHVVPGVRFAPTVTNVSRKTPVVGETPAVGASRAESLVEPRASARFAVSRAMSVRAAFGVYHQPPGAEDLSAVFGTPTLGPSTAKHYLAGGAFTLAEGLGVELTVFRTESEDLATRSASPAPLLANALTQNGRGRSYGAQALVRRQRIGRFFGWVSYSVLRSERSDDGGATWRLFDFDQTHVFTALGAYDLGAGFEVGLRVRAATGYPRTPVLGAYWDVDANAWEPRFGARNSIRIEPFFSADVRVAKTFKVGPTEAEIYVDVQNVTNHKNAEELVYNTTYTQRGTISGLPILPVAGARLSW